jgi:hypothetical protein
MEFADLFAISSVWMVTWSPLRRAHHGWSRAGRGRVVVAAAFGEGNRCKDDMKFGVVEVLSATGILRDNPCVIRRSGLQAPIATSTGSGITCTHQLGDLGCRRREHWRKIARPDSIASDSSKVINQLRMFVPEVKISCAQLYPFPRISRHTASPTSWRFQA